MQEVHICDLPEQIIREICNYSEWESKYKHVLLRDPVAVVAEILTRKNVWNNLVCIHFHKTILIGSLSNSSSNSY